MPIVTRGDIRDNIRMRLNYENNPNISDSELNYYINQSAARLYALIVQSNENFYNERLIFDIPGTELPQDGYQLPQDVWRVVRVDRSMDSSNNNFFNLNLINFKDENGFNPATLPYSPPVFGYDSEVGTDGYTYLRIFPQNNKAGHYRIIYNPHFQDYTDDADPVNLGPPGLHWEEYVILDVCAKVAMKTETEAAGFLALKKDIEAQIKAEGAAREAGQTAPVPMTTTPWWDRGNTNGWWGR